MLTPADIEAAAMKAELDALIHWRSELDAANASDPLLAEIADVSQAACVLRNRVAADIAAERLHTLTQPANA